MFAAQAARSEPPSTTISRVNLALYRRGIESRFVTLMYGALEADGRLTYCNAGHNPPLIIGAKGDNVRRLECGGPIVGLFEGAPYDEETVTLSPGDWLIVFSDGVSEALSATNEEFGEERLQALLRQTAHLPADEISARIAAEMTNWIRDADQYDDLTFIVMKMR
jgi:sigma-B regulation protein RsbU (phosphoserine phosphatase)